MISLLIVKNVDVGHLAQSVGSKNKKNRELWRLFLKFKIFMTFEGLDYIELISTFS